MRISVKTIGLLKDYHPGESDLIIDPGISVRQVILMLNIPTQLVAMVIVNDVQTAKEYILNDDDRVQLIAVQGGG